MLRAECTGRRLTVQSRNGVLHDLRAVDQDMAQSWALALSSASAKHKTVRSSRCLHEDRFVDAQRYRIVWTGTRSGQCIPTLCTCPHPA